LEKLMDNWPDAVKQEIAAQGLPTAKVDLPTEAIGEQLKSGRVAFEWHSLRGWLTPAPVEASSVENIVLDLPLKVVAPLFFGSKGTENKTQRLTADANIPDVFAQAGKPSHPPAPVAPAPPVPTPVNPPVDMSPEGIVTRAAALKGVAGAFIALPDGLLVASRLPRAANGESLAAFLPQVCAKFDASLTALGMGTLNDLSFRAGKVPWRVFRTSKVFFAVFGGEQAPLPVEGLTVLAGELEKH
jgi:predicted regulator of Ras-like GTPase activity (Roadblock/LC7/MglB family)